MKKLLLFAAVAGLGLVSASPPDKGPDNGPDARRHYPPCSRSVRDSCIQLYERGVRARHHRDDADLARDEHRGHGEAYARDDHRWCPDHHAYHGGHHGRALHERRSVHRVAMAARASRVVGCRCAQPARRQMAQRVRRAGERG